MLPGSGYRFLLGGDKMPRRNPNHREQSSFRGVTGTRRTSVSLCAHGQICMVKAGSKLVQRVKTVAQMTNDQSPMTNGSESLVLGAWSLVI
jgi:hypothetical protein